MPQNRGFVPTMGALHEGHLSLLRHSQKNHEISIVSIFVNPTQFGKNEDFSRYPRQLEKDLASAVTAGADAVFLPDVRTIYPLGEDALRVHVADISEKYEGQFRPGHFDGSG